MTKGRVPTPAEVITRPDDARLRRIVALHGRAGRDQAGRYLIDGIRFLHRALDNNAPLTRALICPELLANEHGRELAARLLRSNLECLFVSPKVYRAISRADEPQGLMAVVRQQIRPLERIDPEQGLCWLALESVQSPGNLGTIIRTCEAAGAAGVLLIGDALDVYDPFVVRATMGSLFAVKVVRTDWPALLAWKARTGSHFAGAALEGAVDYHAPEAQYPRRLVLFMGWERRGLSEQAAAACDQLLRIPMAGALDSLNVAVAAGVLLYEAFNRRRAGAREAGG